MRIHNKQRTSGQLASLAATMGLLLTTVAVIGAADPMDLWIDGTQLRGANLWQRIVVPDLDGPTFLGSQHVGPPVVQADFTQLAELGANLVVLSHPGPFTERPPYRLDALVQANLDRLIDMADQANLYVVIALRTGPGRSDFTFYSDGAGDWYDCELLIEAVWTSPAAQQGWIDMWRHVADRYKDHAAVIGYELMVEPNGADIVYEVWDPEDFYPRHEGSLADWNQLYPRLVTAVRSVDRTTPVLVGSMSWSSIDWLPWLQPIDDPRIVYTVHQYAPQSAYTHQEPDGTQRYPGWIDLDWDGQLDRFDRSWIADRLQLVVDFREQHDVPVAITEFGLKRWVPDAASFMTDQMAEFDALGLNHALWAFYPGWQLLGDIDDFDILHGPDPDNHLDVDSLLRRAIQAAWLQNTPRQ